jgi:hypothetical protein
MAERTLWEVFFFALVAAIPIAAVWRLLWVIEGFAVKKDR